MESIIIGMLEQLGISGVVAGLLYLVVSREACHRKEKRDAQIDELKQENKEMRESLKEHVLKHDDIDKSSNEKISRIYERLNLMSDSLSEIKGYMRGKNDKGN